MHLTLFYPELNRFDIANHRPFSGAPAAMWLHRSIDLHPDLTWELRLPADYLKPLNPTTHVLGLGVYACNKLLGDTALDKHRGYRKTYRGRPAIVTYSHIDCWEFSEDENKPHAETNDKDIGTTNRANYLFWSLADFRKLLTVPQPHAKRTTEIGPDIDKLCFKLNNLPAGSRLVIDIETRLQDNTLDCIGLGVLTDTLTAIYVVPIYNHTNTLFYGQRKTVLFWRTLYNLFLRRDVTVIGHNLSFDLSILSHYYHLPFPPVIFDTMLFMHRHNANIDKSLSHAISYYTDATTNHKGGFCPNITAANFRQLLTYNGDDIYWTGEVYRRQVACMDSVPGLRDGAEVANKAQPLCLLMSFTGIEIDVIALNNRINELELELSQLARIAAILTGNPTFNPNSSQQVAGYFYGLLGYEVPEYTPAGAEATGEGVLYELQLKQPNPMIAVILAYKAKQKEKSMLEFTPYERHNP